MKITTTGHDWSRNSWFVGSGNDGSSKNCSTRRSVRKHTRQFLRCAWEGWVGCSNHWGRNEAPCGPWSPLVFLLAGMESARFLQIWWTETKTKKSFLRCSLGTRYIYGECVTLLGQINLLYFCPVIPDSTHGCTNLRCCLCNFWVKPWHSCTLLPRTDRRMFQLWSPADTWWSPWRGGSFLSLTGTGWTRDRCRRYQTWTEK